MRNATTRVCTSVLLLLTPLLLSDAKALQVERMKESAEERELRLATAKLRAEEMALKTFKTKESSEERALRASEAKLRSEVRIVSHI